MPKASRDHVTSQTDAPVYKTLRDWHHDLGHINTSSIISLSKSPDSSVRIKGPKTPFFCDVCVKSGMTRHYSQRPMSRSLRPLEKIHMDISGGGRTFEDTSDHPLSSRHGTKYFLIICDDATRFCWVYFLCEKSDVYMIYEHWSNFIRNLGFSLPTYVCTDIDGVFRAQKMQTIFARDGSQWQPTAPDSPWQDGVSERIIRTVVTRTRSVLLDSGLPKIFWADVLKTVVNITNNTPTSVALYSSSRWPPDKSWPTRSPHPIPFSALVDPPLQAAHLQLLGSPVYVHLHSA